MSNLSAAIKSYFSKTSMMSLMVNGTNLFVAIITILLGIDYFRTKQNDPSRFVIKTLIISYIVYLGVLWVLIIWREFVYSRKARFAEAVSLLHESSHSLRDTWCVMQQENAPKKNTIRPYIKTAIEHFANAFSLITGTHCRACIKMLYFQEKDPKTERNLYVTDLCRSEDGWSDPSGSHKDWVCDNTDFLSLLRDNRRRYFTCNNLTKLTGYKNSHWSEDIIARREYDYISTIVWPIRQKIKDDDQLIGFLCIDSQSRNVFEIRHDFALGAAVADNLYIILKTFNEKCIA